MSGIFGFLSPLVELGKYKEDINKLALWNKAYGNDNEEIYWGKDFCLGCYCEKLSDTAKRSMPVLKHRKKYAVIDAILYNREELEEVGERAGIYSDEELLFLYIEKYGCQGLKDVNGDFCGAIYDEETGALTLFRDHLGVRPLFYYVKDNCIAFSTDIRGIVSMQSADVSINEKWLWNDIVGATFDETESTEFANILCVKPASYLSIGIRNQSIHFDKKMYWRLGKKKIRLASETAYIKRMQELVTDAVKRRLDAVSGLVGAELSGGLDSGVIDILINRMGRECVYYSWSVSTDEVPIGPDDERLVVEDICKQEGIFCNYGSTKVQLGEVSVFEKKMCDIGIIPEKQEDYMRRYILPPYINTLQICDSSRFVNGKGAKVVFTGHGGDEGVSHRCNPYELFYHKEYLPYLRYIWSTTYGQGKRIYKTIIRVLNNLSKAKRILRKPYVAPDAAPELLKKNFFEKYNNGKCPALTFAYDTVKYVENGGSRNRMDVVALLGAYSGVRYLIPYMDYRIIDYAVSIPRHMYLKNRQQRYIFREAFKEIIPTSLYELETKYSHTWKKSVSETEFQELKDKYISTKRTLVERLDRKFWEKYLDFDTIDQWVMRDVDQIEESNDMGKYKHISRCITFQNLVTHAKDVGIFDREL